MSEIFDAYTLIFLVVAVVIFIKLRSVLGRRTGTERPPFDPYSRGEEGMGSQADQSNDKVITLPRRSGAPAPANDDAADIGDTATVLDGVAKEGSRLEAALKAILAADRSFDPRQFVDGARMAYEMIVTAFASGERKALKPLLAREVYDGFEAAIGDRESRSETVEFTFIGLDKAEITEAELANDQAQVTVRFQSQLISATRDQSGDVVDGDPNKVSEVTDIWTFARDVRSNDPNWKLIATESPE